MDDVSITELSFGQQYSAAVEAKQVAQQEAQRAVFTVEQAKQERQQKIVLAEGDAESASLVCRMNIFEKEKFIFSYFRLVMRLVKIPVI